jgi:hypothetical protein
MRTGATVFLSLALIPAILAAAPPRRTLSEIPGARESLSRMVSPKFYQSLAISKVEGWVAVRGQLVNGRLSGAKLVHSEMGGLYDQVALELANNLQIVGFIRTETLPSTPPVLVNVLIYEIADGRLAISFAQLDGPGGSQMRPYGSAWMAVEKRNHLWETIDPRTLAPNEKRGPRMYTMAVESPQSKTTLPRGVGIPVMRDK